MSYRGGLAPEKDSLSGLPVAMDVLHHIVHGKYVQEFHVEDLDLDTSENLDTLLITGSKEVHITLDLVAAGGRVEAFIYEGATVSANGTAYGLKNRNRNGTDNTLEAKLYTGPTVTGTGTEFVKRQVFGTSSGQQRISSQIGSSTERVFKPNTIYLIRQTAKADNCMITLDGLFYER
jgi:hypothetical protein